MSAPSSCLVETVHSSTNASGAVASRGRSSARPMHLPSSSQKSMTVCHPPTPPPTPIPFAPSVPRTLHPQLICTISAGFEKGDYLIREERGSNVYFDFFEEAYNFATQKGYARMPLSEEREYMAIVRMAHRSVPGGCRFNTGRLLLVLRKRLVPIRVEEEDASMDEVSENSASSGSSSAREAKKLRCSDTTPPTDMESTSDRSGPHSKSFSTASTSYVDSWE